MKVLLEMTEVKPDLSLEVMWDHIENSVTKSELRAAVAVIDELVPVDDAELNGQRLEELSGRLATVRIFLPSMMGTVEFGATSDGVPVLAAMKTLAELMTAKTKLPATWLDARKVDHDLIGGDWKKGQPGEHRKSPIGPGETYRSSTQRARPVVHRGSQPRAPDTRP